MRRQNRIKQGKRCLLVMLALLLCLPVGIRGEAKASLGVSAASAVLMEAESGAVLYEKDADARRPMASTTKIMTALVAIEENDLAKVVSIPKEAVGVEGSSVYLVANEKLTMEQLLYALMLESANDAATAIAILTAGSVADFAVLMNRKATDLGLADTSFENPHGLDGEGHYTTARDLAKLAAYALQNETFRRIVSTYRQAIPLNGEQGIRVLLNHNRLLRSYEGCVGVKTGFTKRSGRCLVTAAEREGVTLVAVTLNASDDWNDHRQMLNYGFDALERVTLLDRDGYVGTVPTVGGVTECLRYAAEGPVTAVLPKGERDVRVVYEHFRFYYAPITEGDIIGRMVWYDGDREIASVPLVAAETIAKRQEKRSFWQWLLSLFT